MLSIKRTSLKASTSSLSSISAATRSNSTSHLPPKGTKIVYCWPDGQPRKHIPHYPTGIHPALVNVHGLASPRLRQLRKPGAPRPRASHPFPYKLDPNAMDRQHLVDTFRKAMPAPASRLKPYASHPTGRNPPISPHYTEGAHTYSLNHGPTTRTDASGATFTHSSPPLDRIPNLARPREAPRELPYMDQFYGKRVPVLRVTGHHKSTEQWNADLAFSVRKGDFDASVKFVEEMRKNQVRCDETTLKLLVEGLDIDKVLRAATQSGVSKEEQVLKLKSSGWVPEATLVLEVEKESSDLNSTNNTWKETLATIAEAEKKITAHLRELALWETEDARIAQEIASSPSLTDRILATTKRILAQAPIRSRGHAVSNYHNREEALQQQVRDLEEMEEGEDKRTPEEVTALWEEHKRYNVDEWESDIRAGWETEKAIWVTVDTEIIQPRKKEMQSWMRKEFAMKSRKQDIEQSLADAREVIALAEKVIVLPAGVKEDGTLSSGSTPIPPSQQLILRRLLRNQANLKSKFTPPSSSSSFSDDPYFLANQKREFLRASRRHLRQSTHLLAHLEALEQLTNVRLTTPIWKNIIGKLSSYRVSTSSLTTSSSSLPTSETWKSAFTVANEIYLARIGSQDEYSHPDPARDLSMSVLDTLLNTVLQEGSFPLAIPTVTNVLHRLLTVDDGAGLRADKVHVYSQRKQQRTKRDLAPLPSLAERNEPIYQLLRLISAILRVARKDILLQVESKSFGLLNVDLLDNVGSLLSSPGMFELDPIQEEGMPVEIVVEGRKMRGLVERVRGEVGSTVETIWDLREIRGTLEGETRPERVVVEEVKVEEKEEEDDDGIERTDEERRLAFVARGREEEEEKLKKL